MERRGKLELTNVTFRDDNHVIQIIDRIVSKIAAASTRPRRFATRVFRTDPA